MQVKYFLTLCSEKSFSKAAQKLYVTQPSFSQFIKKIEADIGAELVDRSSNPIRLTEAGDAYYTACVQFSAIEEDFHNAIENISELNSGRLVIGTTAFRASTMLAKSISAFKSEYPNVDVSVTEGSVKFLESSVLGGEFDLAICSGFFDDNLFHFEALADEHLYMAVSRNNPINEQLLEYRLEHTDITENSLKSIKAQPCPIIFFADEPYIHLRHGESISEICNEIYSSAGIKPKIVLDAQNLYTAMSFVLESMGITIVPDTMIKYANMKNHPYYYSIDSHLSVNKICLLARKKRYLSRAASEYSKILKQLIQSGTWRI